MESGWLGELFLFISCRRIRLNSELKHAYVTGGSTGLGLSLATILVERGAHVSIIARNQGRLDTAISHLEVSEILGKIHSKIKIPRTTVDTLDNLLKHTHSHLILLLSQLMHSKQPVRRMVEEHPMQFLLAREVLSPCILLRHKKVIW